jgi:hypothetical protein
VGGAAARWRVSVQAGPRRRIQVPVVAEAPAGLVPGSYRLERGPERWPAQVYAGRLLAVLPNLAPGEERVYELVAAADLAPAVTARTRGAAVDVHVRGQPFTTLHLEGAPKPFLHPLLAPGGVSVVRGFPVQPRPGDSTDHPHHRGAWVGHGDVNGMDAWEERPDRLGRILVDAVAVEDGPVCAHVALDLRWVAPDGRTAALERRLYRFWCADGQARLLDLESTYASADGGPVRFGDTKEGALCGVRVATGMEGKAGGRITTAEGALGEREAWGSAAGWCDYSGMPLEVRQAEAGPGQDEMRVYGVAILDHPDNPLYPTRWHVRDYGLMAANPFALSHYRPGRGLDGSWTVPAGGSATFRFRLCVHREDAEGAEVCRRYADWAYGPRVRVEPTEGGPTG